MQLTPPNDGPQLQIVLFNGLLSIEDGKVFSNGLQIVPRGKIFFSTQASEGACTWADPKAGPLLNLTMSLCEDSADPNGQHST